MKMFLIAVALLVLGGIAQLPVSAATTESLEARIAEKEKELPGCSPELLKWLVETDQIVQSALQKESRQFAFSAVGGGGNAVTVVDLYCDAAGKWQELGGPYFTNVADEAQAREVTGNTLHQCLSKITLPPKWFHDSVQVEFRRGFSGKALAGVYVDTRYFDVNKLNRIWVSRSEKLYPPKEDPYTDQWLAKLEKDISQRPSTFHGVSWQTLIPPQSSLSLAFSVSKEGLLNFIQLDRKMSVEANQAALQLLIDRLPLLHRPRNISSKCYLLEVSNASNTVRFNCSRAGRIVAGRTGQRPPYFDDSESFSIRFKTTE